MKLGEYLSISGDDVKAFAARAGIPEQSVYKYLQEEHTPGSGRKPKLDGRNMQLITAATDGKVTVHDYYDIPPLALAGTGKKAERKGQASSMGSSP